MKYRKIFLSCVLVFLLVLQIVLICLHEYEQHSGDSIFDAETFFYLCVVLCIVSLLVFNSKGYYNLTVFSVLIVCSLIVFLPASIHREDFIKSGLFLYIIIPIAFSCLLVGFHAILVYTLLNLGYILICFFIFLKETAAPYGIDTMLFFLAACIAGICYAYMKSVIEKAQAGQVRNSVDKFGIIFEKAGFGIAFADPDTKKFCQVNKAFCELLGYPEKDVLNKSVYDIHPRGAIDQVLAQFDGMASGKINTSRDVPLLKNDGTVIYVNITSVAANLDNRWYAIGFFHDNTSEYLAGTALKASEEQYRFLVENLLDFVVKTDTRGNFLFASSTFCEFMGYREEEIQEKNIFGMASEKNSGKLKSTIASIMQPPYKCYVEYDSDTPRGIRWFGWHVKAVLDAKGQVVSIIGTGRDITARVEVEEKLRLEMEKARHYLNVAGVIIVAIDKTGIVTLINKKGSELLGCREEEIIGNNWFDNYIPADIRENVKQVFYMLMEGSAASVEYFENPIINRQGIKRIIAWHNTVLRDKDDRIYCTLSSGEDITDRKKAETEREFLIRELEARNTRLEQFSYTASHDLKTPLITIKGFLSVLEEDILAGNSEERNKDFTFIRDAVDKMWNLLNDLLQYSRLGKLEAFEEIPFSEIAADALQLLAEKYRSKNITVRTADDLPVVTGDRTRLVQLIQNLLDNAAKFTGSMAPGLVEIGCNRTPANDVFYVRDNGIGIEPEYQQKIFQLFQKLNPAVNGTGIGLTIAKRIVEIHSGEIWVESAGKNAGVTVFFTLARDKEIT